MRRAIYAVEVFLPFFFPPPEAALRFVVDPHLPGRQVTQIVVRSPAMTNSHTHARASSAMLIAKYWSRTLAQVWMCAKSMTIGLTLTEIQRGGCLEKQAKLHLC